MHTGMFAIVNCAAKGKPEPTSPAIKIRSTIMQKLDFFKPRSQQPLHQMSNPKYFLAKINRWAKVGLIKYFLKHFRLRLDYVS